MLTYLLFQRQPYYRAGDISLMYTQTGIHTLMFGILSFSYCFLPNFFSCCNSYCLCPFDILSIGLKNRLVSKCMVEGGGKSRLPLHKISLWVLKLMSAQATSSEKLIVHVIPSPCLHWTVEGKILQSLQFWNVAYG